jgi:hypothetical protein
LNETLPCTPLELELLADAAADGDAKQFAGIVAAAAAPVLVLEPPPDLEQPAAVSANISAVAATAVRCRLILIDQCPSSFEGGWCCKERVVPRYSWCRVEQMVLVVRSAA